MKTLSIDEIDCLLEIRKSQAHPLDILGHGYTSEGARRFRAERPDFLPQIAGYVQGVLRKTGIFPKDTNPDDPGFKTFIRRDGASFTLSSIEEVGLYRYERTTSKPMSETAVIRQYIQKKSKSGLYFCCRDDSLMHCRAPHFWNLPQIFPAFTPS